MFGSSCPNKLNILVQTFIMNKDIKLQQETAQSPVVYLCVHLYAHVCMCVNIHMPVWISHVSSVWDLASSDQLKCASATLLF